MSPFAVLPRRDLRHPSYTGRQTRYQTGLYPSEAVTRLAFIPALAPGLNGSGGLMRMHHRTYSSLRDKWRTLILEATAPKDRTDHAPCKVTITRHTTHLMDVDNAYAASKVVLDALRYAGLLADDDPGCVVSLSVPQVRVSKRAEVGTVIELTRA